jgi:putative copper export protein
MCSSSPASALGFSESINPTSITQKPQFLSVLHLSALSEPYGELLIAKVIGFALLMGLAAANKWRLGPALVHGAVQSGRWFRRSAAVEYVLIAAVLTLTAVMTSFFSPEA